MAESEVGPVEELLVSAGVPCRYAEAPHADLSWRVFKNAIDVHVHMQ